MNPMLKAFYQVAAAIIVGGSFAWFGQSILAKSEDGNQKNCVVSVEMCDRPSKMLQKP